MFTVPAFSAAFWVTAEKVMVPGPGSKLREERLSKVGVITVQVRVVAHVFVCVLKAPTARMV
ncbi:hypothetical protein D3C86_1459410 [compost metagenome]